MNHSLSLCFLFIFFRSILPAQDNRISFDEKINGVNFVAPADSIPQHTLLDIDRIGANWIAITPYAYTPRNSAKVLFYEDHPHWWGEGISGTETQIAYAKSLGFKVMLKPHVWVLGDGWPGEFSPNNEESWLEWERGYSEYMLRVAEIANEHEVEVLCIGTEYCKAVVERPQFWQELIREIKTIYTGELTYAANWDNYQKVSFWKDLDYIGIDAYFPLSADKMPVSSDLDQSWNSIAKSMKSFSQRYQKPIILAEYGYRSSDYTAHEPWKENHQTISIKAQELAYASLYRSIWHEDWLAGGFLWKWHAYDAKAGGRKDPNFTPQNKATEKLIRSYYCR